MSDLSATSRQVSSHQEVAIATASDERYAAGPQPRCCPAATACSQRPRCVFLSCGLDPGTEERLQEIFEANGINLIVLRLDAADLADMPVGAHFSSATYGRLFLPKLLREVAPRTLYIDPDTFTIGPIDQLLSIDCMASRSRRSNQIEFPLYPLARVGSRGRLLGIPPATAYLSAGVLVIDNKIWSDSRVEEKALDLFAEHGDVMDYVRSGRLERSPSRSLGPSR